MVIELPSLYPHQEAMRDESREKLRRFGRVVLCAPPGTGKTRISKWILGSFSNRPQAEGESGKALFVVHRRGLVDNASNSFGQIPSLPHGVIMSQRKTNLSQSVQVASIDTMNAWYCEGGQYTGDPYDLIVFDECVSGDSIIETDIGRIRIDQVSELNPSQVLSYSDEKGVHFARILNWKHSGVRDTLEVHTHVGKIQCTPDHQIYTRRGWLEAQFVLDTDEILVCADAERHQYQADYSGMVINDAQHDNSCPTSSTNLTASHRCVPADAERKPSRCTTALIRGRGIVALNSASTQRGMTTATVISYLNSRRLKDKRSSERCLAIPRSGIRTSCRRPHGSLVHMGLSRRNGLNTRQGSCIALGQRHASPTMQAGAKSPYAHQRHAIRHLSKSTNLLRGVGKRPFRVSGWIRLETSGLRGGLATMDRRTRPASSCTQRDFPNRKTISSLNGFVTTLERQQSATITEKENTLSGSPVGHKLKSDTVSGNTFQGVCNTNWFRVTKIVPANQVAVYDIEVEKSHCFFANNLLVHNCHAHVSKLRSMLGPHDAKRAAHGLKPAYVLGLSATPQHKDLNQIFKTIVRGPSPQLLIDNGHLSSFRYFRATQGNKGLLVKKGDEYTEDSVSAAMQGLSGDLLKDWMRHASDRATVGFFPRRSHALEAAEMFNAAGVKAMYLDGNTPDDERLQMFSDLNEGRIQYIANVGVIERGTDIPRIGCVQMCTFIGSIVRWLQMIGRGSRIHPDVPDCLVLDHGDGVQKGWFFEDTVQWSLDWGERPEKTHQAAPTIQCPKCGLSYRGGKCRCGYEPSKKERKAQGLEFLGGELQEVQKPEKKKKLKSNEKLMIDALYQAAHTGRSFSTACAMARKAAEKQGTYDFTVPAYVTVGDTLYKMIPWGHADSKLPVKLTYGAFAKNYSLDANPYRER